MLFINTGDDQNAIGSSQKLFDSVKEVITKFLSRWNMADKRDAGVIGSCRVLLEMQSPVP